MRLVCLISVGERLRAADDVADERRPLPLRGDVPAVGERVRFDGDRFPGVEPDETDRRIADSGIGSSLAPCDPFGAGRSGTRGRRRRVRADAKSRAANRSAFSAPRRSAARTSARAELRRQRGDVVAAFRCRRRDRPSPAVWPRSAKRAADRAAAALEPVAALENVDGRAVLAEPDETHGLTRLVERVPVAELRQPVD